MKNTNHSFNKRNLLILLILWQGISFSAFAHEGEDHSGSTPGVPGLPDCQILAAARLFDGIDFLKITKLFL